MKFTAKQYAQALFDSIHNTAPAHLDKILDNFVTALAENNQVSLFSQIEEEFHKIELESKGIKQAEVVSSHALTHENEKKILDELNKLVSVKIELKKRIDEGLMGGVVIRLDDKVIDASTRSNLEQLKQELSN
ncbi:MAG: ATP synthase F1 subunit delta [Candidatus Doudnabacteria bacterium]|nr:ATP synthase F1 subunit delta [Candidatus Doudnabacteria bacterium]